MITLDDAMRIIGAAREGGADGQPLPGGPASAQRGDAILFGEIPPGTAAGRLHGRLAGPTGARALDILIAWSSGQDRRQQGRPLCDRWPTTFVEESNLRVQLSTLCKALGDGRSGRASSSCCRAAYTFVAEAERTSGGRAWIRFRIPRRGVSSRRPALQIRK